MLLGAPTGSGKTLAAELAIFRVFKEYPKFKVDFKFFYFIVKFIVGLKKISLILIEPEY